MGSPYSPHVRGKYPPILITKLTMVVHGLGLYSRSPLLLSRHMQRFSETLIPKRTTVLGASTKSQVTLPSRDGRAI